MNVKLDWQVGEDNEDGLGWAEVPADSLLGRPLRQYYVGLEKHPDLLRLPIGKKSNQADADLYLLGSAAVLAFLLAMYLFV